MTRRRGMTLVEILLAVLLLGLFGIISTRLIRANFHVERSTRIAADNAARFDNAISMLRADLADSVSTEMPAANQLRIHQINNTAVDWQIERANVSRKQGTASHSWELGHQMNMKMDGAVLLLSSPSDPSDQIAFATPMVAK